LDDPGENDQSGQVMKLLVFGGTGGTGCEIVAQALGQGHVVTAFVRNPAALTTKHENLKLAKGDILDYPSVEAAVRRQDAVLSALGVRKLRKNTILSDGTKNIIRAMEQHGVKRFVCESSLGVGDSKEQLEVSGPGGSGLASDILRCGDEARGAARVLRLSRCRLGARQPTAADVTMNVKPPSLNDGAVGTVG
jgi:hypothetical protein